MTFFTEALMVSAAGVCLTGSARSRQPLTIAAAVTMLLAMLDLAWFKILAPPHVWAALLLVGGVLLGASVRLAARPPVAAQGVSDRLVAQDQNRLHLSVSVLSALAYVAMAWLVLQHGHSTTLPNADEHVGHGFASASQSLTLAAIAVLACTLLGFAVTAVRHRRFVLVAESAGMAAMLLTMLTPIVL